MSDSEIIIHLLRSIEWRLRANRLFHELMLGLSIVLACLVALKIWDLFYPFQARTIRLVLAASALLLAVYALWRFRIKGTLDQAAASIDRKAGLNDEIKTAFWFIKNPRPSQWVDRQIQRAARNANRIDVHRAYPGVIPGTFYTAASMILIFAGLNFAPLPLNHNWLILRAAPLINPVQSAERVAELYADREMIQAGLLEIAAHLQESERLSAVAKALIENRLDQAAEELRKVGATLGGESPQSMQEIQESFQAAAGISRPGLDPLAQDLAQIADALRNKNVSAAQQAIEQVAEDFEGLEEEIYKQESTLDQLASGNERRAEQDGNVSGAPIPEGRDFLQPGSSTDSLGAFGGNAEAGPREGKPTTLAVKLQQEALKGMPNLGTGRVDVEEASRRERSKLDYRNVKSELTAAQKDVLNQESMPWKYRPLIKNYFQTILDPAGNK